MGIKKSMKQKLLIAERKIIIIKLFRTTKDTESTWRIK